MKKEFDIKEWKEEFVKKYGLDYDKNYGAIFLNDCIIINRYNDVNFKRWHNGILNHDKFKFDGKSSTYLIVEEDFLEFEKAFSDYWRYLEYVSNSFS